MIKRRKDGTFAKGNSGIKSPYYKGGYITKQGYRRIPKYNSEKKKYQQVYEQRFIMEQFLGRKLKDEEVIHHIDGNKLNNKIENLEIETRAEHYLKHQDKILESVRNSITFNCEVCGKEVKRGVSAYSQSIHHLCSNACRGVIQRSR